MDTKTFLGTVLGGAGYYCVAGIEELHGEKRDPDIRQTFYTEIDDALGAANAYNAAGYNAYFALATFVESGSRRAANVQQMKSLFLDLDCGPNKDYPTQSDALVGLRGFCKTLKLPKPMLVNSGRGIHVYWPLIAPVAADVWIPVAERLKALCVDHGLFADPAVTSDSARVLRVPGTLNYKDTPPNPVAVIGGMSELVDFEAFRDLLGVNPLAKKRAYVPREVDAVMMKLMGSYVSKFKTIMLKTVDGKGCGQLQWIAENQATMPEPMWRAGLSIAAFCEDKDVAIHKISSQYEDYSQEATEHKASQIRGPYSCETFNKYNPNICTVCPNWGKITNPLALGRELETTEEEVVVEEIAADLPTAPVQKFVIPKYPEPYVRGANGGIFKRVKEGDEVTEIPVYHHDLYVVRRLRDPDMGESIVMRLHLPKDGVREFTLPFSAVTSRDEFRRFMSMHGVAVMKVEELMSYVTKWVNDLQMTVAADDARRQFGWVNDNFDGFVLGNVEIRRDGLAVNPPASNTAGLFPAFVPKGTLEGWKETIAFYDRPGFEVHQYMFGLSFGSILMQFSPLHGSIFHLHSKDSGLGKTTAMYAGASVWGDPDVLVMLERDTYNSKMNRAEIFKNLPLYFDEMTNTAPKDLSDFAYQIPSGQQRNRLSIKGNVERYRGAPWKTLVGTTGNTDMVERISAYKALPKAEAQRILSYRAPKIVFTSKEETDLFSTALKEHYGHAGIIFVQYIIQHSDEVRKLILATQKKIDTAADLKAENRFWSIQAASTVAGLLIAKQIGLISFDMAALFKWIVKVMREARIDSAAMGGDVESILTDYLAENYNNMLRITSLQDVRKDGTSIPSPAWPEATPRAALVGRYEYDVKKLYLLPKPLKNWCVKHQLNYLGLLEGLKTGNTKLERVKMRLSRGTHVSLPATDVLMLDCTEFMDEEKEQVLATTAIVFEKQSEGERDMP